MKNVAHSQQFIITIERMVARRTQKVRIKRRTDSRGRTTYRVRQSTSDPEEASQDQPERRDERRVPRGNSRQRERRIDTGAARDFGLEEERRHYRSSGRRGRSRSREYSIRNRRSRRRSRSREPSRRRSRRKSPRRERRVRSRGRQSRRSRSAQRRG